MSYSDDRDEISELFGLPRKQPKGYSEELEDPVPPSKPVPEKQADPSKPVAAAPKSAPVAKKTTDDGPVKRPVKLRPPSHVEPHPLEASPLQPARKPAPAVPPETVIEDEELLVYGDVDFPDFSSDDFVSFDEPETKLPPKGKPSAESSKANPVASIPARKSPAAPVETPVKSAGTGSASTSRLISELTPKLEQEKAETKTKAPVKADPSPKAAATGAASTGAASTGATATPAGSASIPRQVATPTNPAPTKSAPTEATPAEPARATTAATVATSLPAPGATSQSGIDADSQPSRAPANQADLLLDTHGLVKIYDGRTVVNGVDINVRPGEIVGLLGPNGAGKTTSFYMIVGLVPPNGGQVIFQGDDVTKMPMYQRARLGMGYLPQEESIFRKLTVEENIMAVMETLKIPRKEKIERCNDLLERFSITHIRNNIALTCSGGEKRRVTIARSLVTEPSLIMLDEPFSGVDPIAVNEIQNIVSELRESGLAILITDHNARQTLELVDRAYLIYEGKVLREGTRDFLINDPMSRELYLGDRFTM